MQDYKIIYQKENGDIFERLRWTLPLQGIGETTSMGWKILDIQKSFKNKWYSAFDYADYKRAVRGQ